MRLVTLLIATGLLFTRCNATGSNVGLTPYAGSNSPCEFYHLMRLDKQTCDWHNKKCDSLYVTHDISKGACQAAGNALALIRVKINLVATNNVASRIFQCEKCCKYLILRSRSRINSWNSHRPLQI